MAEKQFDVPKKLQRLFEEKQKVREAIRQKVLKRQTNPYLEPGCLVDPAIVKYHAAIAYRAEYARPNKKNVFGFIACVIIPVVGTFFALKYELRQRDRLCREGLTTYEERYKKCCL